MKRLAACALFFCCASLAVANERPNVIVILSDDMGFSDIGCYGGEIRTPHLDRLARNGIRFSQFYNFARCCPSRACLMTGLYPHQTGMGHMEGDYGLDGYRGDINRQCVTMAQVMGAAGYSTYMAGKWHLTRYRGPEGPMHNWPLQRGFDRFYGTIIGAGSFFDPATLCRGNTYITPENDPEYQPETFYYTDAITDNALQFLQDHERDTPERPWFLYLSYTTAHWPMHALPADIARYKGQYDGGYDAIRSARKAKLQQLGLLNPAWELPPGAGDWENTGQREWEIRLMEVYAAMVDNMDQGIGRILGHLENHDALNNTLILYLQDNGACAENLGRSPAKEQLSDIQPLGRDGLQTRIWPPMQTRDGRHVRVGPDVMAGAEDTFISYGRAWANVSNTPFREYKHWVHEGGIATPLIAHWPTGIRKPGTWHHQPAHLIDLMPTMVQVTGATYPATLAGESITPLEGVSLQPVFQGDSIERRQPLCWEHEGNRAIRSLDDDGKWKLVARHNQPWELYDMETDRTETRNLAQQHPQKAQALANQWQRWADRVGCVEFGIWNRDR